VSLSYKVPGLQTPAAVPGPDGDFNRDALALAVLSAVLDGYSGARLDRALTQGDNRLADSAGASSGLIGRGPQLFTLDGVPAEGKTTQQVADALRQQVALIAREGVSQAELQRVKTQWVASETYKLDAVFSQARELGSYWVNGLPLDADKRLVAQLRSISSAEVQAVAARYFSDDQLTQANLLPQPPGPPRARPVPAAGSRH
jgi:zinc protease